MAGNILQKSGTAGQTLTLTLASLGNNSARASTAVDNTSNNFLDALVQIKAKTGASGVSTTGYLAVYAYASVDGGTTYTEGATGSDAALTMVSPTNLRQLGTISAVANATTYTSSPMSVAQAFGGVLPDKWGVVVQNVTGAALDSTEGNHAKLYQGFYEQYT